MHGYMVQLFMQTPVAAMKRVAIATVQNLAVIDGIIFKKSISDSFLVHGPLHFTASIIFHNLLFSPFTHKNFISLHRVPKNIWRHQSSSRLFQFGHLRNMKSVNNFCVIIRKNQKSVRAGKMESADRCSYNLIRLSEMLNLWT